MAALSVRIAALERDCESALGDVEFAFMCQQERCKEHFRRAIAEERNRTEAALKEQAEGAAAASESARVLRAGSSNPAALPPPHTAVLMGQLAGGRLTASILDYPSAAALSAAAQHTAAWASAQQAARKPPQGAE